MMPVVIENTSTGLLMAGVADFGDGKPTVEWLDGKHHSPGAAVFDDQLQAFSALQQLGIDTAIAAFHPCPPDCGNFASVLALGLAGLSRFARINVESFVVGGAH